MKLLLSQICKIFLLLYVLCTLPKGKNKANPKIPYHTFTIYDCKCQHKTLKITEINRKAKKCREKDAEIEILHAFPELSKRKKHPKDLTSLGEGEVVVENVITLW